MSKKSLLALSLLAAPLAGQGATLGPIHILSAPGAPFHARIPIHHAGAEMQTLHAEIAPAADFAMLGLGDPDLLRSWTVQVDRAPHPHLQIRAPGALTNLRVSFLIRCIWSGNQVLQEYTLNPGARPVTLRQKSAAPPSSHTITMKPKLAQPHIQRSISEHDHHFAAISQPSVAGPTELQTALHYGWSNYREIAPTRAGDVLSKIATLLNGSSTLSINQIMAALVRANQQAFINGNPNVLRTGVTLRIPTLRQVEVLTPAAADLWMKLAHWTHTQKRHAARKVSSPTPSHATAPSKPAMATPHLTGNHTQKHAATKQANTMPPTAATVSETANLQRMLVADGQEITTLKQRMATVLRQDHAQAALFANRFQNLSTNVAAKTKQLDARLSTQAALQLTLRHQLQIQQWISSATGGGNVLSLLAIIALVILYRRQKKV
jgi:pilus assembly protein FimV